MKNFDKKTVSMPSHTYCLSTKELVSLRAFFDYGYSFLCAMVISLIPTFPAESSHIKNLYIAFLVAAIFVGDYGSKYFFVFEISLIVWFLIVFSRKFYHPYLNRDPVSINDKFEITL